MKHGCRLLILILASFTSPRSDALETHVASRFSHTPFAGQETFFEPRNTGEDKTCDKNFLNALEGAANRVDDSSVEEISMTPTGIIARHFCPQALASDGVVPKRAGGVGPVEPVGPPGVRSSSECAVSPVQQLGSNRSISVTVNGAKTQFLFLAKTDGGYMLDFKGPLSRCY